MFGAGCTAGPAASARVSRNEPTHRDIPRQQRDGPEIISKDLDFWAYLIRVELDFSRTGKPTDNAYIVR